MTESAVNAFGTKLEIETGLFGSGNFLEVAECTNLSGPSIKGETMDVTTHDQADGWREHKKTLKDGGEIQADIFFIPTNLSHQEVLDRLDSGAKTNSRITFSDDAGTFWLCKVIVTNFEPGAPVDGMLTGKMTLKVTGKPTFA